MQKSSAFLFSWELQMARTKRGTPPSYRRHSSGQACVTVRDPDGRRREILLGRWESPESRAEYARILAEIATNQAHRRPKAQGPAPANVTVNAVILAFWRHAEQHYRRPDGTPTGELDNLRDALRPLRTLYGRTRAWDFDSACLEAVQEELIRGGGLCRTTINARVNRIRRVFRWGVRKRLVPVEVIQSIDTVPGLQRGRTAAPEPEGVLPVAGERVQTALPFMPDPVAAMVRVQLLTTCRAGEVMSMRAADLATGGDVWVYRPNRHKNQHRGLERTIFLGPQAQEIIKPFLTTNLEAYLFSPRAYVEAMHRRRAEQRKSKRTPSELKRRRKANPRRVPAERYNRRSYRLAVVRACDKAFPLPEHLRPRRLSDGKVETGKAWWARLTAAEKVEARAWRLAHRWHPLQLRHTAATSIREKYGVEAAKTVLGHTRVETTQIYAEQDAAKARRIIAEIG
jgi:site-specific recombinase XerD